MAHDRGENGVVFRFTADGEVRITDYIQSTSEEMQSKILPIVEEILPKVRQYFEDLLKQTMAKKK
jgi:hypothetical protein